MIENSPSFSNSFRSTIDEVCKIFLEVTGFEANPIREGHAIMHWVKNFGWEPTDFRLIMEFCISDETEKTYFSKPGKKNIRTMFNPARGEVLIDIHADLKKLKEIKNQRLETRKNTHVKLLMKCGAHVCKEDLEEHLKQCLESNGGCF